VDVPVLDLGSSGQTVTYFRSFANVREKLSYLYELGTPDSMVWLAGEAISDGLSFGPAELRALHDWRAANVVYRNEPEEILETARHVMWHRQGQPIAPGAEPSGPDCEDHFVLGCALARARSPNYFVRAIALGGTPDDPQHCSMLVGCTPGLSEPAWWAPFEYQPPIGWYWSETSQFPAEFGESPLAAYRRRGGNL